MSTLEKDLDDGGGNNNNNNNNNNKTDVKQWNTKRVG